MRSLVGLIAVILTATFYLYLLSFYIPPGPRLPKQDPEGETRKSNDGDTPSETKTAVSRCAFVFHMWWGLPRLLLFAALTADFSILYETFRGWMNVWKTYVWSISKMDALCLVLVSSCHSWNQIFCCYSVHADVCIWISTAIVCDGLPTLNLFKPKDTFFLMSDELV